MVVAAWQNGDGLQVRFGNWFADPYNRTNRAQALSTLGAEKQLELDFDLSLIAAGTTSFSSDLDNNGTLDGFNDGDPRLPANASVLRATILMTTAATGGTSITVGTYKIDGTTIGATSLVTATEGVIANLNAIGKRVYGTGSLVSASAGTGGVGTSNAYIGITTTGTFTAGKGKLIIEYIDIGVAEAVAP